MLPIRPKPPIRPKQSEEATEMNRYKECRLKAAQYNDALASREKAAEELGISKEQLRNYEVGLCKTIPPDNIILMADTYNSPELLEYYCTHECPIGQARTDVNEDSVSTIVLQLISLLRQVPDVEQTLLDVAADGKISDHEKEQIMRVSQYFDRLHNCSAALTKE